VSFLLAAPDRLRVVAMAGAGLHLSDLEGGDGFQVVAALRHGEQGTGRHLPVIALTARSPDGERERGLRAGMPVRAAELFAAIDRAVRGEAFCRPVESAAGIANGLLDPSALLAAYDGVAELLRKMFQDHVLQSGCLPQKRLTDDQDVQGAQPGFDVAGVR
jgi:CheY-like chemotaxis protein